MFKDFKILKNGKDCESAFQFKLIDGNFTSEKNLDKSTIFLSDIVILSMIIIETYSNKQLPVVPNLIRAMLRHRDKFLVSLDRQVELNKLYNIYWPQYEKEIKKYLIFS